MSDSLFKSKEDYLPFLAAPATDSERASFYEAMLDLTTLNKVSETNGEGSAITKYEFRIDTSSSAEHKKIFMPMNGLVLYFPAGASLPNGLTASTDTLAIYPSTDALTNWLDYHPYYSPFITAMYISNIDTTTVVDGAGTTATDEKLKKFVAAEYLPKAYLDYVHRLHISETLPADEATLREDFYTAFKTTHSGYFALAIPAGSEIGVMASDAGSPTISRIDMRFSNAKKYPYMPDEGEGDYSYEVVVGNAEETDLYDDNHVATFFQRHQRMVNDTNTFAHLAGHPMITLIVSAQKGLDTSDLSHADRASIDQWFSAARVDIVNYATGKTKKSSSTQYTHDTESDTFTIIVHGPIPTSDRAHYPDDTDTDYSEAITSLTIYNPDNLDLVAVPKGSYIEVDSFTKTGRDGYYDLFHTKSSSVTSSMSSALTDTIEIRLGSDTGDLLMEVDFLVLPFKLLPVYHYRVISYTTFDDGTVMGESPSIGEYDEGPDGTLLYDMANIGVYTVTEDPTDVRVEVKTLADFEVGHLIFNDNGSDSDFFLQCQSVGRSGAINIFYVTKFEDESKQKNELAGLMIPRGTTTWIFSEVGLLGLSQSQFTDSHEITHALHRRYLSGNALADRHLDHGSTDSDGKRIIGEYGLKNNLMRKTGSKPPGRLTSNQARILNAALS